MDLKHEGVTFNATYNATLTEDDFVANGLRDGLYSNFDEAARIKLLKDAYKNIKEAVTPAVAVPPAEAETNTATSGKGSKKSDKE